MNKTKRLKIAGFLSFGIGLFLPVLPFAIVLFRLPIPLFRYGILPLLLPMFIVTCLGFGVIIHRESTLSTKILAILGILFSLTAFATPFLFLAIH